MPVPPLAPPGNSSRRSRGCAAIVGAVGARAKAAAPEIAVATHSAAAGIAAKEFRSAAGTADRLVGGQRQVCDRDRACRTDEDRAAHSRAAAAGGVSRLPPAPPSALVWVMVRFSNGGVGRPVAGLPGIANEKSSIGIGAAQGDVIGAAVDRGVVAEHGREFGRQRDGLV